MHFYLKLNYLLPPLFFFTWNVFHSWLWLTCHFNHAPWHSRGVCATGLLSVTAKLMKMILVTGQIQLYIKVLFKQKNVLVDFADRPISTLYRSFIYQSWHLIDPTIDRFKARPYFLIIMHHRPTDYHIKT